MLEAFLFLNLYLTRTRLPEPPTWTRRGELLHTLKILQNAYVSVKLTQNEVINIKFSEQSKKFIFVIDEVTMTSLWRHYYVIFHIFRAKNENFISLELFKIQNFFICRSKAFTKFWKMIDDWNGYISFRSGNFCAK